MALEIVWTRKAAIDFNDIQDYLFSTWGESSVKKFTNKVFNFLELLSEFPLIGTMENKESNIRGFVIVKQLTLFYQVRDNRIILLRFYDNRQDPKPRRYE
jgi:plasmid stabilization system protein ParE